MRGRDTIDRPGQSAGTILEGNRLSLVASLVLVAGADSVALLFVGRLLAGVSSGAVFSAGTAWLREPRCPRWALPAMRWSRGGPRWL
ncbi:MAG: hypothetical protein ACR2QA_19235 [Solirubrobacteraceae bacterium]